MGPACFWHPKIEKWVTHDGKSVCPRPRAIKPKSFVGTPELCENKELAMKPEHYRF